MSFSNLNDSMILFCECCLTNRNAVLYPDVSGLPASFEGLLGPDLPPLQVSWLQVSSLPLSWAGGPQLPLFGSTSVACCCPWSCLIKCLVDLGPDPDPWTQLSSLTLELPCLYGLAWWSGLCADPGYNFWIIASRAWSLACCLGTVGLRGWVTHCMCRIFQHSAMYNSSNAWGHVGVAVKSPALALLSTLPPEFLANLSHSWSVPLQNSLLILTCETFWWHLIQACSITVKSFVIEGQIENLWVRQSLSV